jgi:hypothetical protein
VSRLIFWYSCGAASAVTVKIGLADKEFCSRFDEIIIAYCYVKEEHSDNLRFFKECREWFGHPIKFLLHKGYMGSIFNVFEKNYMRTLKKQVREKFQQLNDVHVMGYTVEERDRADKFIDANNDLKTWWPLIEKEITKENCLAMIERAGIELPEMYKLGYEHNNCVGCVKGGMGYWNKIRVDFPDEFKRMADFEKRKGYTVLKEKDKATGKQIPIYLHDLDPKRGRMSDEPKIECGIFCELEEKKYNG